MLSIIAFFLCLTIQLQFLGMIFHFNLCISNDSHLGIRDLCHGIHESRLLESQFPVNSNAQNEMPHFVPYNCYETQCFELRNKYETPCVVYNENEFFKFIMSLHDMCTMYKCSPDWDGSCSVVYYKNEISKFVLSRSSYKNYMACKLSQEWVGLSAWYIMKINL